MKRSLRIVLFVASLLVAALAAAIDEGPIEVRFEGGAPRLSFSARELGDASVRRGLKSGLAKQIVLTVQAYPAGSEGAIATVTRSCRVTYDLWEEDFVVRAGDRHERFATMDEVLARCLDVEGLRVGRAVDYERLRGKRVYFAVRAEFNPISSARCHGLLRKPGSSDPIGPVVVNIVRREICRAEKAIEFRSPDVEVPR